MNKPKAKPTIFAYCFDAAGFAMPQEPLETAKYTVQFIGYSEEQSLEHADGIITPSGVFETFHNESYSCYVQVRCDKDHLAKREKEVFQNFKRGGWIAFLLRSVDNNSGKWDDTDLAKRFLNSFFYNVGWLKERPKKFDALHINHAEKLNIKILRTTMLLEIIRLLETEKDRGSKLLQLFSSAKPVVELK